MAGSTTSTLLVRRWKCEGDRWDCGVAKKSSFLLLCVQQTVILLKKKEKKTQKSRIEASEPTEGSLLHHLPCRLRCHRKHAVSKIFF